MIRGKGKHIMMALLCTSMLMGVGSCCKTAETGKKTNHTDYSAPKIINSDQICEFYASFYLGDRWTAADSHNFCFRIETDESNVMTVYEDVLQISCQADSEITKALQEVIVKNSLAEMNGINAVTDNLAPGYQRCSVKVDYISGEKLQFDINNDPHARWAEDVYAVFAEWFTQNGNSVLYPKGETSQIESFVLKFKDEEHNFRYRTYTENSKESAPVCIEKTVYDISTYKIVSNDTVALTADYFRTIAEIADSYNLGRKYDFSHYDHQAKNYGNHAKGYYGMGTGGETDEKDLENLAFSLYIKYESGKTINIETSKASEIEGMMPLIADFVEYHISLF